MTNVYTYTMIIRPPEFEWDPAKRDANLLKHGVDFAVAIRVFDGFVVEWEDKRRDHGEARIVAVGNVEGRTLTVVYPWRGARRRIISARRSRWSEERTHAEILKAIEG